jgi:hypothetical protein
MKNLKKKLLKVAEKAIRPVAYPGPMAPSCQYIYYQPKRKRA